MNTKASPRQLNPADLIDFDSLLSVEEKMIRDTVRKVCDDVVEPHIRDWYEQGEVPARELAQEFAKIGLASYKYPRYIEFRTTLPMTATGKILKRELVDEEG